MTMTPEAKVKKKVVAQLKEMGAYYFYPVTGGYGASGVPDIVGCYRGMFFGIECKAGSNKPTPLQDKNLTDGRAVCNTCKLSIDNGLTEEEQLELPLDFEQSENHIRRKEDD